MKKIINGFILFSTIIMSFIVYSNENYDVKKILKASDEVMRGKHSVAECTMDLVTAHYQRTMKFKTWAEGMDRTLLRVVAPAKDKGVATLKIKTNIWNYLPKTDKTIKLPSSMMMQSWMGSHFTNDDLVKASTFLDDYTSKIKEVKKESDKTVIVITLIPNPTAAVIWGKVVLDVWDHNGNYIPLKHAYYDEHGKLTRTMELSDIKQMSGREMPTVLKLAPADKPNEYTQITYNNVNFDSKLDARTFTLESLKKTNL